MMSYLDDRAWRDRHHTGAGNFILRALFGSMNPEIGRSYRTDLPDEHDIMGRTGVDALAHQLDRNAARASYAMENVTYWSMTATNLAMGVTGLIEGGAQAIARPVASGTARLATFTAREIAQAGKEVAPALERATVNEAPSVARNLMALRDEAVRITDKLATEVAKDGGKAMSASRRGEVADAVLKGLVRDAIERGVLPAELRIAPAPSSVTGLRAPNVPVVDFWLPTGEAFDLMTATAGSVAGHDLRYIGRVMLDGTVIRDVFPLVYQPLGRSRPSLLGGMGRAGVGGAVGLGVGSLSMNAFAETQRRSQQAGINFAAEASKRSMAASQKAFQDLNRRNMERNMAAQQDAIRRAQQATIRSRSTQMPSPKPIPSSRPGGGFGAPHGIDPFRGPFRASGPINTGPRYVPARIITHDLDRTMSGRIIPGPIRGTEFVRIPGHYR
jgi:hypothetical protein